MGHIDTDFTAALATFTEAANTTIATHLQYKQVHGQALLSADAKNAEGRLAQADLASLGSRAAWEKAKVAESSARAHVDFLIARASTRPPAITGAHIQVHVSSNQDPARIAELVKAELETFGITGGGKDIVVAAKEPA